MSFKKTVLKVLMSLQYFLFSEYHAVKNESAPASEPSELRAYYPRCKLLCQVIICP